MLKIYNSLSNKIEEFKSINKMKVNMYVCGPTVYDDIHIGNGRPVVFFDLVKRYLTFLGYEVVYASNITDIDDKIINKANQRGITEKELSNEYTNNFLDIVKAVGALGFDHNPHATDYINQIVKFIENLINEGYAYVKPSGVYFNVTKVKDYGLLSNQKIEDLKTGVRIDVESDKENSVDFVLWKFTNEGIKFPSIWGEGRPGWHTECVVMNQAIFNEELDIHGGGFDLKFPHHENEIAQSVAHNHHHLSKYWMHVGRVDMGKVKMSKSLGNDIKIKNLLTKYDGYSYRLMLLAHHYRMPFSFSEELIEQYQKSYDKISYTINKWAFNYAVNSVSDILVDDNQINIFKDYMNDDFNTGLVITQIDLLLKDLNKTGDKKTFNTLLKILEVLGVEPRLNQITNEDKENYSQWLLARENKDFSKADSLRKILNEKGWI